MLGPGLVYTWPFSLSPLPCIWFTGGLHLVFAFSLTKLKHTSSGVGLDPSRNWPNIDGWLLCCRFGVALRLLNKIGCPTLFPSCAETWRIRVASGLRLAPTKTWNALYLEGFLCKGKQSHACCRLLSLGSPLSVQRVSVTHHGY